MHNVGSWFGTWDERRINHQPLQCMMRQTLSFKQALNMHASFVPKLKYGVPFKNLVLREWTSGRTLFLRTRNCKLVVQSFAASDDTTTGTGGRERARGTGKLQMGRKKESRRKKRQHFVRPSHFFLCRHCTTRDYDVKFPYGRFIDDVNKGEQIFLSNFFLDFNTREILTQLTF